ncbi:MAG: DeoR/GlpR transcriptional regulator [Actinomycetales bacterium]|nr:MAG: DeoR/GlpR transcriptional regulator [Actinomycetales bacterium]
MYAAERRALLASRLSEHGRVSVVDAADELGVSGETIRRDLDVLQRHGLARRVHGGAVARSVAQVVELGLTDREAQHAPEKEAIAHAALAFLPDADGWAAFDAGTSTAALVDALPADAAFDAVTHGTSIASSLARHEGVSLLLVGGRVRPTTAAAVGADTVAAYGRMRLDVAFLGTNGIALERGLTTPDVEEAAVKRALVAAARRVVVLADSSKIDTEYAMSFAPIDEIDVLVTDRGVAREQVSRLERAGVEVVVA